LTLIFVATQVEDQTHNTQAMPFIDRLGDKQLVIAGGE
jgi:hypothetical protein